MAEQYEHMTLEIEDGKVIKVDKPPNATGSLWGSLKVGLFEPLPDTLLNKNVAFALNQLSAQNWEVMHLPTDSGRPPVDPNPFPPWPGPSPAPKADRYQILLRRSIRK